MSSVFLWVAMPALLTSTSRRSKVSTLFEQCDDRVFFGEVGRQRQRFAAFGFDARRDLVQQLGAARHQHGLRALGGEQLGDAAADAVAGAGDDRDLALELSGHPVLPFMQMPLLTKGPLWT